MKFMILGSEKEKSDEFVDVCSKITETICERNDDIAVCSPYGDSADSHVMKSFSTIKSEKKTKSKCYYFGPQNKDVDEEFDSLNVSAYIEDKRFGFGEENQDNMWLFSQIRALNESDFLIAIGGNEGRTSEITLGIAQLKNKKIITISSLGGSARKMFYKLEYDLNSTQYINLGGELIKRDLNAAINKLNKIDTIQLPKENKVFISYPREMTVIADYLEMILRRRNIIVFRDESDFIPGANIQDEIIEKLNSSNIFISLWCKENACSPWCYDEFEIALDKRDNGNDQMKILILTLDDTRMIHPRARDIISYPIKTKKDIQLAVNLYI